MSRFLVTKRCQNCGEQIAVRKKGEARDRRYCSLACSSAGRTQTPSDRIANHIEIDLDTKCWNWRGGETRDGYRIVVLPDRKAQVAHRFVYEHYLGPIPSGLTLDHLCRNRACCNPDHLEPVTIQENIRRGTQGARLRQRTHCNSGHEFTPENTAIMATGARRCRECQRIAARARYHRRLECRAS